jgi:hypothetical protein
MGEGSRGMLSAGKMAFLSTIMKRTQSYQMLTFEKKIGVHVPG